jgi:hypothetical protein
MKALFPHSKIDSRKLPRPGSTDADQKIGGLRLAQKLARQKILDQFQLDMDVDSEEAKQLAGHIGSCWCVRALVRFTEGPAEQLCYTGTLFGSTLRVATDSDCARGEDAQVILRIHRQHSRN